MAGAGYKLFATGDVLTAAQVNTYLMQQTVMVFASSAARTTALSGVLAEGMVSYLQDTNTLEVYDGSAWVGATGDITGLTAGTGISISSATGPVPTVTNSMATEITAKGDLIVGTGSGTFDNLAAGSNGDTIVADSSASSGLRYQGNYAAGKNAIINGAFNVWQRGTSFTASVYTADRWYFDCDGTTKTAAQQTFTPGTAPVAGYEGTYFIRGTKVAGSYAFFQQPIEDVRTFAGQTVTLSFWAKASTTVTVDSIYTQNFGSGGSGAVSASVGSPALTTSWQRFTYSFAMPSVSGKTIGTSSYVAIQPIRYVNAGNLTVDLWGVQLEAGSVATAFQTATGTLQGELAACQRYFPVLTVQEATGYAYATNGGVYSVQFPVQARTPPTGLTIISGSALAYALNVSYAVTPLFNAASVSMANLSVPTGLTITAGQGSRIGNGFVVGFTGSEL